MTAGAVALVLLAALAHASWNLLAKRGGARGVAFVWIYTVVEMVLWAPIALGAALVTSAEVGVAALVLMLGSAVLHSAYVVLLQRGYATGDLSFVYPFARGLAPLIAVGGAVLLLGEQPTLLALAGAVAVAGGVVWIGLTARGGAPRSSGVGVVRNPLGPPLFYALATATMIAGYTVWDGYAMQTLTLTPILYHWGGTVGRVGLLAPAVWGRWDELRRVGRDARTSIVGIALLAPLAYMLVLWAFTLAPVSYVAPAREASIVVATAMGVLLLGERSTAQRVIAAAVIAVGVFLLSVA
ncbi:EamA family transporter [Egibacter rhizosphaerae]|uniref:EamA family transporter n=1 Tax=Egibacter rhizosphaerae TaxID=1670831 RepID=A0A411YEB5_9ACTN|nr:EamA family transporter [Egibacter rhizosphaerae]QBI19541.1 EamA family transporter [Egibacter rhizosphaerae]